jgi:hypothetical protein
VNVGTPVIEPQRLADEGLASSLGRLPEVVQRLRRLRQRSLRRAGEVDSSKQEVSAGGV